MDYGWLSLIPPLLAILLAFLTREPVFSLAAACFVGVLIMGQGLTGFPELLAKTLGSHDFMWICLIEICIGILVALLSSLGSACDHMDHVKTQLPYALVVASIASFFYLIVGIF